MYDKHNSLLLGLVDLGETNNHLLDLELSNDMDRQLAKSMLVLTIRGMFTHVNFPLYSLPVMYLLESL